jgi:hypothetical protein
VQKWLLVKSIAVAVDAGAVIEAASAFVVAVVAEPGAEGNMEGQVRTVAAAVAVAEVAPGVMIAVGIAVEAEPEVGENTEEQLHKFDTARQGRMAFESSQAVPKVAFQVALHIAQGVADTLDIGPEPAFGSV